MKFLAPLLLLSATIGFAAESSPAQRSTALSRFEFTEAHMAVDFRIVLYAPNEVAAKEAAAAAFARIKQIDEMMSDYKADSELSKLSDTSPSPAPVHLSDDLWRVLNRAKEASQQTSGAFDCTVGPIVKLWRRARRTGDVPSPDAVAAARKAVGDGFLELDREKQTARLLQPKMRLDLGGIAKGYGSDAALVVLKERGISRALVAGSGDIAVGDPPPGKKGWRIGVAPLEPSNPPNRYVLVADVGVSTSGDSLQHVEIAGRRYSHVIDPRTGIALTDHCSVTVVAPNATASDALSTGISVLGPKEGIAVADKLPGTAAFIVRKPGEKAESYESSRWRRFEAPNDSDGQKLPE
ncbi:MAG TPA: FAD:protein FMN transferase [Pirellulales bacterium]|nr:FAD:protein FMN transferase [Pirellulales bacterium]